MSESQPTVIHWFRRDLRITDNTGLMAASAMGMPVVPVYLASVWKQSHRWTGGKRQEFLCGCLKSLAGNLETAGGRLVIRHGDPLDVLPQLVEESRAVAIHFNRDPDPYGKRTEARLSEWCRKAGVMCVGHDDVALHTPDEVLTQSGAPYRVYTPYSRNWLSLEKRGPAGKPRDLRTPERIMSEPLPTLGHWGMQASGSDLPVPGEKAALERLRRAVRERVEAYAERRNIPGLAGTSRLSQDLRFGLVSVRRVYADVVGYAASLPPGRRGGCDTFVKELAWREFYLSILHHYPQVLEEEFNAEWRGLPWDEPGETWEAWKEGCTGFPIVDAGMRELAATGYMHNRVRMIVAMFLTKDLHLDWRHGEAHFMRHLLDGEIASNNGGWQWSAGTGADAAPYFRIQNPWSQSARYDPEGVYIKRWVPELAGVDSRQLVAAPSDGKPLAPGYPLPCVDHAVERERTLQIFQRHREETR